MLSKCEFLLDRTKILEILEWKINAYDQWIIWYFKIFFVRLTVSKLTKISKIPDIFRDHTYWPKCGFLHVLNFVLKNFCSITTHFRDKKIYQIPDIFRDHTYCPKCGFLDVLNFMLKNFGSISAPSQDKKIKSNTGQFSIILYWPEWSHYHQEYTGQIAEKSKNI